ncbi:SDR family NAD(P)-dependent oxidoreductase [Campylobacter sp. 19-13652]|uniref:SDR family NAD(P)-dependent oxidoreductase n=1 Tax=Campylobacter sp. 19-13652 TaxID=2840180 RepID=UPI001C759E92|nr:SDR family oxidoreductase [Campylobacter sp. 19-13652]BCX79195.1 glucose-1-dehydrogenase [Campylobacter sp. 19-13652]
MINLKDKNILLIGATGRVGASIAHTLDALDANITLIAKDEKRLDTLLSSLNLKSKHKTLCLDMCDIGLVEGLMKDALSLNVGKFDGLVYAAGVIPIMPIKNTTFKLLLDTMSVNFFAFVEFVRIFSNRKFHNLNSSIVALSSFAALSPDKGQIAYGASKGAMDSAVVAMAKELFKKQIRVNAIRPAIVRSDARLSPRESQLAEAMGGTIEPASIAEQVAFLLSDLSSGVYGRCFDVRGYLS